MAVSSVSSGSSYNTNAVAGINSGLDTEAIVDAMTSNIQSKIDENKQDTQVAEWKQDAYREIITDLEEFYDEYFKYSSSDKSITNEAFFNEEYITSSSSAVSVTGGDEAMQNVVVEGGSVQLATKSSVTTTHQISASAMEGQVDVNNLSSLGGSEFVFEYNGKTATISIDQTTADSFVVNKTATGSGLGASSVDYLSEDGLKNFVDYMNGELAREFGEGAVTFSYSAELQSGEAAGGWLGSATSYQELIGATIEVSVSPDSTFSMTTQDASVMGEDGILGLSQNVSNKINVATMKLSEIGGLTADENGNYTMSVNGQEFSFDGETTLREVMSEINSSDAGVRMSYASVTNTFSLIAEDTGSSGAIQLSGSLADAIFGAEGGGERSDNIGKDFQANMSFDGGITFTTVTRDSNSFAIDGASYNFTGVGNGEDITFQHGTDTDALVDKVKTFVEKYNEIMSTMLKAVNTNKYGENIGSGDEYLPLTDAQREEMSEDEIAKWEEKAKTGLLSRDSTVQDIIYRMRSAMTSLVDEQGLYQYGIDSESWSDKGVLTIDEDKLRAKIQEDPDKVADLFAGENGIASKVKSVLTYAVKGTGNSNGVLVDIAGTDSNTTDNTSKIAKQIASLKEALEKLETKLDTKKEYWWNKFTYLESYISSMNSQSSFLSSFGGG